jgi:signal transduction histidine kinase
MNPTDVHEQLPAPPGECASLPDLARRVLRLANRGVPRRELCEELLGALLGLHGVDEAELRVNDGTRSTWALASRASGFQFSMGPRHFEGDGETLPGPGVDPGFELLCREVARRAGCPIPELAVGAASCRIAEATAPLALPLSSPWGGTQQIRLAREWSSMLLVPFTVDAASHGLIAFKSGRVGGLAQLDVTACEAVAETLGLALADRRAQAALRERVKELSCLYGTDQILGRHELPLPECLRRVVELLPPAWLYPDHAQASIVFDGAAYSHPAEQAAVHSQRAPIVVRGRERGTVTVAYVVDLPALDEGPFLREERALIESVALKVGFAITQREAADEQARLELQLRHADRLATIGQLAAGVAHELNEPLGNVLGFAQLARKGDGLPASTASDLDKIIQATLHAREVISRLMLFARQRPPVRERIDLNKLVNDGLFFLSARCSRSGIDLVRRLGPDVPPIVADPTQLYQVLVNLVVNAIQAMPGGGTLTITTSARPGWVELAVVDTGIGMSQDVLERVFVPFFTTKDVGEGTGLGLPVVHGIVTGHGGTIDVASVVGQGSRFVVRLPNDERRAAGGSQ